MDQQGHRVFCEGHEDGRWCGIHNVGYLGTTDTLRLEFVDIFPGFIDIHRAAYEPANMHCDYSILDRRIVAIDIPHAAQRLNCLFPQAHKRNQQQQQQSLPAFNPVMVMHMNPISGKHTITISFSREAASPAVAGSKAIGTGGGVNGSSTSRRSDRGNIARVAAAMAASNGAMGQRKGRPDSVDPSGRAPAVKSTAYAAATYCSSFLGRGSPRRDGQDDAGLPTDGAAKPRRGSGGRKGSVEVFCDASDGDAEPAEDEQPQAQAPLPATRLVTI